MNHPETGARKSEAHTATTVSKQPMFQLNIAFISRFINKFAGVAAIY